jgi:hypothetical protein
MATGRVDLHDAMSNQITRGLFWLEHNDTLRLFRGRFGQVIDFERMTK